MKHIFIQLITKCTTLSYSWLVKVTYYNTVYYQMLNIEIQLMTKWKTLQCSCLQIVIYYYTVDLPKWNIMSYSWLSNETLSYSWLPNVAFCHTVDWMIQHTAIHSVEYTINDMNSTGYEAVVHDNRIIINTSTIPLADYKRTGLVIVNEHKAYNISLETSSIRGITLTVWDSFLSRHYIFIRLKVPLVFFYL